MFRYPTNQRLEITLRHLRGEKAVDLSREYNIPERQIRRWKKIAIEAVTKRLSGQLTFDGSPLHNARRAMRRLYEDVKNWNPDFSRLDSISLPETRFPRTEAPPSAHKTEDGA